MADHVLRYLLTQHGDVFTGALPEDARVVHLGLRPIDQQPSAWAVVSDVDAPAPSRERRFLVVGTGARMPPGDWEHVTSAFDGSYVWHWFQEVQRG